MLAEELRADVVDLSADGRAYPESKLVLELFLARHAAETLLFEVDTWGITTGGYSYPFHEYEFLPYIRDDMISRSVAEVCGPWRAARWKYLPMWAYGEFNEQIGVASFSRKSLLGGSTSEVYGTGPEVFLEKVLPATGDPRFAQELGETPGEPEISAERQRACRRILEVARGQGVNIVMFLAPAHREWKSRFPGEAGRVAWYRKLACDFKVPLLVVDDAEGFQDRRLYADASHLNASGARIFTRCLAEFVKGMQTAKPSDARLIGRESRGAGTDAGEFAKALYD
ncbi:MAG TPA: hypothetical protein VG826_32375 [Pirellulales bacterium]|nr:hypothetical protein [Pirellulales bacterium]